MDGMPYAESAKDYVQALQAVGGGADLLRVSMDLSAALVERSGKFRTDERDALRSALHAALLRIVAPAALCTEAALLSEGAGTTTAAAAEQAAAACLVTLALGNFPPAFKGAFTERQRLVDALPGFTYTLAGAAAPAARRSLGAAVSGFVALAQQHREVLQAADVAAFQAFLRSQLAHGAGSESAPSALLCARGWCAAEAAAPAAWTAFWASCSRSTGQRQFWPLWLRAAAWHPHATAEAVRDLLPLLMCRATLAPLLGRLQELPVLQLALQVASPPPPAFPYKAAAAGSPPSAKASSGAAAAPGTDALAHAGVLMPLGALAEHSSHSSPAPPELMRAALAVVLRDGGSPEAAVALAALLARRSRLLPVTGWREQVGAAARSFALTAASRHPVVLRLLRPAVAEAIGGERGDASAAELAATLVHLEGPAAAEEDAAEDARAVAEVLEALVYEWMARDTAQARERIEAKLEAGPTLVTPPAPASGEANTRLACMALSALLRVAARHAGLVAHWRVGPQALPHRQPAPSDELALRLFSTSLENFASVFRSRNMTGWTRDRYPMCPAGQATAENGAACDPNNRDYVDASSHSWTGVTCNRAGNVTCLNLAGYGLRGAALGLNNVLGAPLLPPLAFLQGLDLHNNQLWGPMEGSWATALALQTLDLSNNELSGPLPDAWGAPNGFRSLQRLQVGANGLTGGLPAGWGNSHGLQQLVTMNVSHNGLSGPLPATWRKNSTNFPSITSVLLFPGNGQLCGPLPARSEFPVRNAEEWNSTNVNAPAERMPLEACPRSAGADAAEAPIAGPDGRPLPLPGLGTRGGPPRPGDSRASIDGARPATSQAEAPATPAPEPLTASDGALAPSEGPSSAVESAPAPDSVLRLPGEEGAAASAAAARLAGSAAPVGAPGASGSGSGSHGKPAWHWVLLALGLVAFVALCAFAVTTLRRRAALGTAATTTYDNQAFVGPNKAPAGAAPATAARETV
ncbi:hypothetical protein WJX81_007113 [Elliptochloris bilobata]|uniref:Leucine-rich repeat-containing N-terminal plant-type domain-containing protein n=1 Tax=Elliptochloris bilobata TaxID=381761 RepID=A0AAW1SEV7_9CHLO